VLAYIFAGAILLPPAQDIMRNVTRSINSELACATLSSESRKDSIWHEEIMRKSTITFGNGIRAVIITASRDASAKAILDALDVASPRAVILLFGGAAGLDDSRKAHLAALFADGVAKAAAELDALIIDGGTQSGVMAMMGEAVARDGRRSQLLGMAPTGKVTYPGGPAPASIADGAPLEPNHSHFVLVESNDWGGETETMLELARAFNSPTVAILVNGGAIAADEALRTVRNRWPLLVIEGSGRFADQLSAATRDGQSAKSVEVDEIARSGCVALFHVDQGAEKLRDELRRMLCC
jgi:TRPM family ion channel